MNLFFYYFGPFSPGSPKDGDKLRGLVSLRHNLDKKLMKPFSDSFKRFKNAFFKVAAVPGKQPWFLKGVEEADFEWWFPLYWMESHYKASSSSFQITHADLLPESIPSVTRLDAYVKKYGV